MDQYQLFTDATSDLAPSFFAGQPPVRVIPMRVEIGGKEYLCGAPGGLTVGEFYAMQRKGQFAATSQINPASYYEAFEAVLREGRDILYLCFTSGMSGTIQAAELCASDLRTQYPARRIVCVDTLCASLGEGLLVQAAARKQAEGLTLDALTQWVLEHRLQVCHWFTVDVFEHLRHGGRVSTAAAVMGTVLQIKPLLHVDPTGALSVLEKPRGQKGAMDALLRHMEQGWMPEPDNLVLVGHGDNLKAAEILKTAVQSRFPTADPRIADIGPVIGAHTGPGMLALVFWGRER